MTATPQALESSARQLTILLAAVGLVAALGAALAFTTGDDPASPGIVSLAYVVLAVTAVGAAVLEWRGDPIAERLAFVATGLAAVLTIGAVTQGWWWFAPLLCIATLLLFLGLVYRFAVRDPSYQAEGS